MKCGYKNKGCAFADECQRDPQNCSFAKYFDFLVLASKECQNNGLRPKQYLEVFKASQPIVDRCIGCSRAKDTGFCTTFPSPAKRWPAGDPTVENKCLLADHITATKGTQKTKINPIKASKRAKRGK